MLPHLPGVPNLHVNRPLGLCIKVGRGHGDACVGTWGRETRDLGTSSMGRGDVWDGDAGLQTQGRRGRWDDNDY